MNWLGGGLKNLILVRNVYTQNTGIKNIMNWKCSQSWNSWKVTDL